MTRPDDDVTSEQAEKVAAPEYDRTAEYGDSAYREPASQAEADTRTAHGEAGPMPAGEREFFDRVGAAAREADPEFDAALQAHRDGLAHVDEPDPEPDAAAREVAHTAVPSRSERAAPLHRVVEVEIEEPQIEDEEMGP